MGADEMAGCELVWQKDSSAGAPAVPAPLPSWGLVTSCPALAVAIGCVLAHSTRRAEPAVEWGE